MRLLYFLIGIYCALQVYELNDIIIFIKGNHVSSYDLSTLVTKSASILRAPLNRKKLYLLKYLIPRSEIFPDSLEIKSNKNLDLILEIYKLKPDIGLVIDIAADIDWNFLEMLKISRLKIISSDPRKKLTDFHKIDLRHVKKLEFELIFCYWMFEILHSAPNTTLETLILKNVELGDYETY